MLNLMGKQVFVVPSESMTVEVKDAIERMPDRRAFESHQSSVHRDQQSI